MYTLISLIPLMIALVVAYPILQKVEASEEDDSMGVQTFSKVLKEAGLVKTITIYGGVAAAIVIALAPQLIEVLKI